MLENVEPKKVYVSHSGIRFVVDEIRRHGQDCSLAMVCYTNLEPTKDYPAGTKWVIVDDEIDFHEDQLDRLVHVDMFEGFGARDYVRLKSVFGEVNDSNLFTAFQNPRYR